MKKPRAKAKRKPAHKLPANWLYVCERHPHGHFMCLKCICGHNFMAMMERDGWL